MELSPLVAGLLAAVVTAVLTPVVMLVARRTGVMDHPGPLKPHAAPVPYLGGVAVFLGVTAGVVGSPTPEALVPLAGALLLGLVDDVTSLPVLPRFLTEVAIGVAVAWSVGLGVSLLALVVVVGTVALINAVNFVDGIDALAAGVCAIAFVGFALVATPRWAPVAAALAGAAAGFLLFNRPPARIYLGDAGSYLLGAALAVLSAAALTIGAGDDRGILGFDVSATTLVLLIPLVGYPLVEAVSTVARRLLRRRPLFAGDRDHVYDQLVQRGLGTAQTTGLLVAAQIVVVGAAVAVEAVDSLAPALVLAAVVAVATILATLARTPAPA